MDKVSVEALHVAREMARRAELSFTELVSGLDAAHAVAHADGVVTWADFVALAERFAQRLPDRERLRALAEEVTLDAPAFPLLTQMREACPTPVAAYELFARFAGPAHVHPVRFHAADWKDGTLTFTAQILPELAASRPFLIACEGVLVQWPTLLGFTAAQLKRVRLTDRVGEWFITLPSGVTRDTPDRARDVFARLSAQQATLTHALDDLHASERDFRSTLDVLPLLVAVHEGGVVRWANHALCVLLEREPSELVGRALASFFPAHEGTLEPALGTVGSGWVRVEFEARQGPMQLQVRSGGQVFFGARAGTLFLGLDLSREEHARQRAARSEITLAAVLGALPELVLHWDEAGRLVAAYGGSDLSERERMQDHLGCTLREVHERFGVLTHPVARQLRDFFDLAQRTRQRLTFTNAGEDLDGKPRELTWRFVPIEAELLMIIHPREIRSPGESPGGWKSLG